MTQSRKAVSPLTEGQTQQANTNCKTRNPHQKLPLATMQRIPIGQKKASEENCEVNDKNHASVPVEDTKYSPLDFSAQTIRKSRTIAKLGFVSKSFRRPLVK